MQPSVHLTRLTPLSFLDRSAAAFPERTAVVDGERRLTWADLRERVRRLAVALQDAGIEKGDRVAVIAPNVTELLEAHYGVPASGAVLVAINTRLNAEEVAYILEHSGSRMVVVDPSLADLVEGVPVERVLVTGARGDYEAWLDGARDAEPEDRLESEDDTISINYTSGTTGRPKGVMYTHRGAYLNALAELVHARLNSRSVYLWTLPMFHCNGWCFTWGVTAVGATHVCLRKVDPPEVWRLIEAERVTHLNGAPTVLVMLISDPAAKPLERPVLVTTAAAPPPPAVLERTAALGFEIHHVYGLTETYGPITICEWNPAGGENISTIEVERALVRHPDVLEAAVVAVPDEKWGERPKGFVTLRLDATLTEAELIAFARETLPGFKAPREIEFCELPKTSTGKTKKFELRERARQGAQAPVGGS